MNKLFYLSSFLLYILSTITFFLLGATFAGLSGIAKEQGLAGGTIVFIYGIIFATIAFVASLFLAYYGKHKIVLAVNRTLAIILIIEVLILTYRLYTM